MICTHYEYIQDCCFNQYTVLYIHIIHSLYCACNHLDTPTYTHNEITHKHEPPYMFQ